MPAKRTPSVVAATVVLAGALLLTACVTGERPSFVDDASAPGTPVGDPAVDAVLGPLERQAAGPFTAEYTILTKFTGVTSDATVAIDVDRRSITIANIRFLIEGSRTGTCSVDSGRCSNSIDDGRVSDLQVTHQFYGDASARRLRSDAARKIGDSAPSGATIAGLAATCVSVPVSADGAPTYCVLENGLLARMDNGDVLIELTSFRDGVDEREFLAVSG
jgi:hypothetical protein